MGILAERKPRKLGEIFWPIFLALFVGIGVKGAYLAAKRNVISSNPEHVCADNYLRSTLGFPNAPVFLQAIFNTLPKDRPILYCCHGSDSNSSITYYMLSSLALPRPVIKVEMDTEMAPSFSKNNPPSAILFYKIPPPENLNGKRVQFGALAVLLMEYPK